MQAFTRWWKNFESMHPTVAQFIVLFTLSNGITVLQLILTTVLKVVFAYTSPVDTALQFLSVGVSHGYTVFLFGYLAGLMSVGGGDGLAYFPAVEITLPIIQVINLFTQRNVIFESNLSIGKAAFWYAVVYVVIAIAAVALQVLYKGPIYAQATTTMGAGGETFADVIAMTINATISSRVFSPIFKVIFKQEPFQEDT